jgi:hypothetical protein
VTVEFMGKVRLVHWESKAIFSGLQTESDNRPVKCPSLCSEKVA